ncbi:MAG: hypothetical protein ACJAUG_001461 [Halioglobus sp.]|jgi:hypothetical protein
MISRKRILVVAQFSGILALLLFTLWVYWPGQYGPPLLDDRGSLTKLETLVEDPTRAREYIFGDKSGFLGRPVSMASFVLEKLYWDRGTAGTKLINMGLHLFNGALVVWLFSMLLSHQKIPAYRWFSLLGAAIWLLSPLYVSTVLYMVQRMTILAALFMLAALVLYVYWRDAVVSRRFSWHYLIGFGCCTALAIFSKENAVIVLPVAIAMEVFWFQGRDSVGTVHRGFHNFSAILLAAGSFGAVGALFYLADWIQAGYTLRHFSLAERLLTESRILWDYVGQLYVPENLRMGLFHDDIVVSSSLFTPISTLYSVVAWALLGVGVLVLCYARIAWTLVFAVSWFLVGHSIESTVLALELYFEHRNYFPGIGLILLLLCLAGMLCKRYIQLTAPILVIFGFYVLWLALQTSSQVQIWSSTPMLRLNHVIHHPESARANEEMAIQLAGVGAVSPALEFSKKSGDLDWRARIGDRQLRDLSLYCLANEAVPADAFDVLGQSNPERPFAIVSIFHGLTKLLQGEGCPSFDRLKLADRLVEIFLSDPQNSRASSNLFILLASFENHLSRYGNAFDYIQLSLAETPDDTRALLMKLHFATALGKVGDAGEAIKMLQKKRDGGTLSNVDLQTFELYLEN